MNSESKTNLLKILLNEPNESPGENKGTYTSYEGNLTAPNTALTEDQLQFQGMTIGLCGDIGSHGGRVLLFDGEGNKVLEKKPIYEGIEISVTALDIDENGDVYGIGVYSNELVLLYLNNIFVPDADGNYDVVIKKAYPLHDAYQEIASQYGSSGTMFVTDIKKSPYGSQFLISWAFNTYGNSNYSLIALLYNVNVGSDNTWDYRLVHLNDYPADYCWIKNITPVWANNSCSFTMLLDSRPLDWSTLVSKFYKVTGNFNEGSTPVITLILEQANVEPSDYGYLGYYASKNAVMEDEYIYFACASHPTSSTSQIKIYRYKNSLEELWTHSISINFTTLCKVGMTKINGEIFAWTFTFTEQIVRAFYFIHIKGTTTNIKVIDYPGIDEVGQVCIIQNKFNLYNIITNVVDSGGNTTGLFIDYLYNKTEYNGDSYFSDNSVTSNHLRLIGPSNRPIFDRNLYNKTQIGNSVTSVTQIPFNYLNDSIIIKENLISETNNVIDEDNEEITKNIYEELYITNIDTFKVWDRNNGSIYNQDSSIQVAKNVKDGFIEEYKIKKYKINYKNGTNQVGNVSYTRTGNIATITLAVYNTGIDNIQLYDENLSIPFLTIDLASYETGKLYLINQKVRVE